MAGGTRRGPLHRPAAGAVVEALTESIGQATAQRGQLVQFVASGLPSRAALWHDLSVDGELFFDGPALRTKGRALAPAFAQARPFPHAMIDGLFGEAVARALAAAFPGPTVTDSGPAAVNAGPAAAHSRPAAARWKVRDHPEQKRMGHLQDRGFAGVAPILRQALAELNGMAFLDFLEALTGIRGLIPDPHFVGGGLHLTPPGGFLNVHTDFNADARRGLKRVLSAIVYLNADWDDGWGGDLELWAPDGKEAAVRIAPRLDRLVVLAQGDANFHGHPQPLACPPDRFRASLATYYFVADAAAAAGAHGVVWHKPE